MGETEKYRCLQVNPCFFCINNMRLFWI